jgi:IS30 family transposase
MTRPFKNNANKVTQAEKDLIKKLFNEGLEPAEIARRVNRNQKVVRNYRPLATKEGIFNVFEKQNWLL